jgi:hypothetical protein
VSVASGFNEKWFSCDNNHLHGFVLGEALTDQIG